LDWTVREFWAFAAGRMHEHRVRLQLAMYTAWHAAAFQRAKKLPRLDGLMRKIGRRRAARKTPAQLLEVAKMITAQMQGSGKRGR
jgi:hypothetical protein